MRKPLTPGKWVGLLGCKATPHRRRSTAGVWVESTCAACPEGITIAARSRVEAAVAAHAGIEAPVSAHARIETTIGTGVRVEAPIATTAGIEPTIATSVGVESAITTTMRVKPCLAAIEASFLGCV